MHIHAEYKHTCKYVCVYIDREGEKELKWISELNFFKNLVLYLSLSLSLYINNEHLWSVFKVPGILLSTHNALLTWLSCYPSFRNKQTKTWWCNVSIEGHSGPTRSPFIGFTVYKKYTLVYKTKQKTPKKLEEIVKASEPNYFIIHFLNCVSK